MTGSGKIAVLMSVYSGDKPDQVEMALRSILEQTYQNFILFVGCDGPLSNELSETVRGFHDDRLEVIRYPENRGLARTLNSLIELALADRKVEFLARMDADDVSLEQRFEQQIQYFESHPAVSVLGTGCLEIIGDGVVVFDKRLPQCHSTLFRQFVKQCPVVHPTVMFRRNVFDAGIRYPVEFFRTEDLALWMRLMREGYEFANIQQPLLLFRIGDNFVKRRADRKKGWAEFKIRLEAMKQLDLPILPNAFYALAHLGVKISPAFLVGLAYRLARSGKAH